MIFGRISRKQNMMIFLMIASIFGPFWKRLQAYIVLFRFEIARMFGPLCKKDCKHIWSQSFLSLQAYLVGHKNYCNDPYITSPSLTLHHVGFM